ncbi:MULTISPECIES: 4'-phosphopantetheinyl transferase [unclassified Dietzia]|uniref:4'-phosphopantetheinyl transferase family protein n=3 Tax=Dietzia TaxID=37914 RepID=UPI000D2076A8|nr:MULTISPECIES: 4'-phosphopantetheinyl transferase superfamily protein [unclassified Dietzia]AVZ39577.1 4'-phosphopantetheinyl transferase [Dietzia sp. JS16-p6b]MBB1025634.1 4'-phosphopantetheinyl transferase superfamily protein [Dietzia sp. DQ12-76]QGW24876.1 4'-phosphopantetheinyl transferase superfamily protein [Dietzia sp. DQ12-45-1b]
MIRDLLPDDVVAVEFDELGMTDEAALAAMYPVEAEQIARAVESRRIEFAAVRACAREAMSRLGVPPGPITRGGRGMPVWPTGVVGTLTHTGGLRAAAVGPTDRIRSLGLDVEPHGPLPRGVLEAVALPEEAAWVTAAREEEEAVHWDRLLFTAKEATYKTWYPLTRRWLGFADAHITLTPTHVDGRSASGELRSRILVDPRAVDGGPDLVEFHGRWALWDGHIASAIALRPGGGG